MYQPPLGANRYATVLLYLTDSGEAAGGHTVFPLATADNATQLDGISFADESAGCDFPELLQRRGLMVQPRRGDALVMYSQLPGTGRLDSRTRHGSCPLRLGAKAVVNFWFWNRAVIYR